MRNSEECSSLLKQPPPKPGGAAGPTHLGHGLSEPIGLAYIEAALQVVGIATAMVDRHQLRALDPAWPQKS